MGAHALQEEFNRLIKEAHDVERELLSLDTDMETHEVRVLREKLIAVTEQLDELSEKMGRKIRLHY